MIQIQQFKEILHKGYAQCFVVEKVLFDGKSDISQRLTIFQSSSHGRILALDGIIQVTEKDEFFYHEMIAHVPILAHNRVRSLLIIGGGDGGTLREVLRHKQIQKVTIVEIDRTVINLCTKYMPKISAGAFDDPRIDLIIANGSEFIAKTQQYFDVIIVDGPDPEGPGKALFTKEFYANCKRCLTEGGLMVTQNGVPYFQPRETTLTYQHLSPLFADVSFYTTPVPTYVGGLMTLAWATDNITLRQVPVTILAKRFKKSTLSTRYYTPSIHWGALQLPPYISDLMTV